MATLQDLDIKRSELNTAIANYTQAVQDLAAGTATQQDVDNAKASAIAKGDEYAKLTGQVKKDDPNVTNDDQLFSNPGLQSGLVREDVGVIMRTGKLFGDGMRLLVDTEGNAAGATNVILSFAEGSNVEIDWGDGSALQTYSGAASHNYATPGQYDVQVTGTVNGFTTPLSENTKQLKDVVQWGTVQFASAERMFHKRTGFTISASDAPTFLPGASAEYMFAATGDFNSDISHWDTSNITNMAYMFFNTTSFNQPIELWNVGAVTDMQHMFRGATAFNRPIGVWDMTSVLNITQMFTGANTFNQPLAQWDTSNIVSMHATFYYNTSFNQDISTWTVGQVTSNTSMFATGSNLIPAYQPNFN